MALAPPAALSLRLSDSCCSGTSIGTSSSSSSSSSRVVDRRATFRTASTSYSSSSSSSGRGDGRDCAWWWPSSRARRWRWRSSTRAAAGAGGGGKSDGGGGDGGGGGEDGAGRNGNSSNSNGNDRSDNGNGNWHANSSNRHPAAAAASAFSEEAIGGEHGEGFAGFRSRGGPLHVDVDFLNDRMRSRGLQRIRYAMRPDEALGLIYAWDNVVADTQALKMRAWRLLAAEEPRLEAAGGMGGRHLTTGGAGAAHLIRRALRWSRPSSSRPSSSSADADAEKEEEDAEVARLTRRLGEVYAAQLADMAVPRAGLREWLDALATAGVPCALAASVDRASLVAILERMGLRGHFRAVVAHEDGMESTAHRFLSAAVKLARPPCKCVVFEDDPRGIAAAHNCSMKAVALIGSHCAYELTQADLAVGSFAELSVINLRRLFAKQGAEFMDLQKQEEERKPCKRRLVNDTLF